MKKSSYLLLIPFGVFMFIVAFGINRVFDHALESPLLGGILQLLFIAAAFAVGSKLVPRFGAFTISTLVFTILFILFLGRLNASEMTWELIIHIGIILCPSLIIDIWVLIFRFKDWARCSGITIVFTACGILLSIATSVLRMRIHFFIALEDKAVLVCAVGSLIGALIGIVVFEKGLRKIRFIRRLIHDRSQKVPIQA